MKDGNYKYYKVGFGITKEAMISNWGIEKSKKTTKINNKVNYEYTYGKYNELIATTYGDNRAKSSRRQLSVIKIKVATPQYKN